MLTVLIMLMMVSTAVSQCSNKKLRMRKSPSRDFKNPIIDYSMMSISLDGCNPPAI